MNYVHRRRYRATPMERLRTNLRYGFRKNFKPIMKGLAEALVGIIWFSGLIFFCSFLPAIFY